MSLFHISAKRPCDVSDVPIHSIGLAALTLVGQVIIMHCLPGFLIARHAELNRRPSSHITIPFTDIAPKTKTPTISTIVSVLQMLSKTMCGAEGGTRTPTPLRALVPETSVYTISPLRRGDERHYTTVLTPEVKGLTMLFLMSFKICVRKPFKGAFCSAWDELCLVL